jgi:hypothetical protein
MAETFQQYKKRIVGYLGKQDPLKVWWATPKKLERLIRGVPRKKLERRPAPGKWSAVEILAHLAEVEIVIGWRLRSVLARNRVRIQAMDQDRWAESGNYRRRDPRQSIALFRAVRESNLRLLRSAPRRKWKHYGIHEERGKESVADQVRLYAGHDLNHLRQLKALLRRS